MSVLKSQLVFVLSLQTFAGFLLVILRLFSSSLFFSFTVKFRSVLLLAEKIAQLPLTMLSSLS